MYKLAKNTLIAFTLSTSLVLANDKTTTMIDIDLVLPKKVQIADMPLFSNYVRIRPMVYSPLQMASIVELKLTGATEASASLSKKEEKATAYSPQQRASIVELQLTAE